MASIHRVEVLKYTPEELLIRQRPGYVEFGIAALVAFVLTSYACYEAILPEPDYALCALLAIVSSFFGAVAAFSLLETHIHAVRAQETLTLKRHFLNIGSSRRIALAHIREVRMEPALFHRAGLSVTFRSGRSLSLTFPPVPGDRFWLDKLALDLATFLPRHSA